MLFTTPEKNARSKTNTRMHEEGSRPKMELGQLDQQEECRKKGRRHFLGGEKLRLQPEPLQPELGPNSKASSFRVSGLLVQPFFWLGLLDLAHAASSLPAGTVIP